MLFGNFFQAHHLRLEEDVIGTGVEYRAGYRAWKDTDVYGHANFLHFDEDGKKNTYGGRVGVQYDGERQDYTSVYVDHGWNRSTFDIAGATDAGDVTTIAGEYFDAVVDWQVEVEGGAREPELRGQPRTGERRHVLRRECPLPRLRLQVHARGGYVAGSRDVVDATENYDESYWYVQAVSSPSRRWYLSLTYRGDKREYTTNDVTSSKFNATDKRPQWVASASFRVTDHVVYILYYSNEDTRSSRHIHDFQTDFCCWQSRSASERFSVLSCRLSVSLRLGDTAQELRTDN